MLRSRMLAGLTGLAFFTLGAQEAQTYQQPDKVILDLAQAELPPRSMTDARGRYLALLTRNPYQDLQDLTQPELRLAGLRVNPSNHNESRTKPFTGVALRKLPEGQSLEIKGLPANAKWEYPSFSPDGGRFAFVEVQAKGLALWVIDLQSGEAKRLTEPVLSAVMERPYTWAWNGQRLYVRLRPSLEPFVQSQELPKGPLVQEARGVKAPARTYQDLLQNPEDERKFEHYARTEIHQIQVSGESRKVLNAGIYRSIQPSPDGQYLLSTEVQRPYSYTLPLYRFPIEVKVTNAQGESVQVAKKPLQDRIPVDFDAVETGRRYFSWRGDHGATLVWVEALDEGNPRKEVAFRDAVFQWTAPFKAEPQQLWQTKQRCQGVMWGNEENAILSEGMWKTRRSVQSLVNPKNPAQAPRLIFDVSSEDVYQDPGDFLRNPGPFNTPLLHFSKNGKSLFLDGEGCSPEGNRPFLDQLDLKTFKTKRLWRAEGKNTYESIVRVMDPEKGQLLTSIQSPTEFPNLYLRQIASKKAPEAITRFSNPFKAMEAVKKEQITYKRPDGVELSAILYTPKQFTPGKDEALPIFMEAYPTEFKDAKAAGQIKESPHQFIYPYYGSPIYWAMKGYAVMANTSFPIVGQGKEEPNDTYIPQLVANAKAAIDTLAERKIGDPKRAACIGHSYGAFMVANLLAHSDLFAAGIARSGAYNRTLTPFGFQSEERNFWQASDVYSKMSPFNHADKIKKPILLIHGNADNNPGTFTLQSERLFQAIKGLGGTARLVLLPHESHGYAAKENILHMLWEQDQWLEKYVKQAQTK